MPENCERVHLQFAVTRQIIVKMRDGDMYTVNDIQRIVSPIADRYGVNRVYLFGSYARGESTPDSDVDLRIDKGRVKGLQMAFLLSDLEDALRLQVDLLSTTALDARFLQRIKGEERLIYERS